MVEVSIIQQGHKLWDELIQFCENCSWKAGPFLARLMIENQFLEWERVIAACVDGKLAGYCTFMEKDELPDEYDFKPFIGFVFVDERYRGHRLSESMIQFALKYAWKLQYDKVYLMSGEIGLYEKYGFIKAGDYMTKYGTVDQLFYISRPEEGCYHA